MAQTMTRPNTRKAALWYAAQGWQIFPVAARGKRPLTANGYKDASSDAETIAAWWLRWPDANIGLACGPSGLIGLDFDPAKDPEGVGMALVERLYQEGKTAIQGTPTGGFHFIYRIPDGAKLSNSPGDLPPGFDVRVNGYLLLTPSVVTYDADEAAAKGVQPGHTGQYEWDKGHAPTVVEVAELPGFVQAMLRPEPPRAVPEPEPIRIQRDTPKVSAHTNGNGAAHKERYAQAALDGELDRLARAAVGGRNEQLNKSAFSLGQLVAGGVLDEHEVRRKLEDVALAIGLDERETRATIESGFRGGAQSARGVPESPVLRFRNAQGEPVQFSQSVHLTDMGNAQRMHAYVDGRVFFVPQFDRWYIWRGTHWQEDETLEIVRLAKDVVRTIYSEAANITDDEERKRVVKWAITSEARSRLDAMVALLRSEPGIARRPQDLDQHPMLLACANGTLDLSTGELLAPDPEHLITRRIEVEYDPAAECPTWERFLMRIMGSNTETVSFIQRLVGHALSGDASGKYLVFMYGPKGNNGKSTLVETISRLLGPYALKSPTEMIMTKSYRGGIPNDIARLRGIRFTVTNEVDEGMMLSESVVKDLTGNDTLTARFMRAEFFDFRPTHKLWIYGNHRPEIRGTDTAIWDRVHLIPFDVEIPKAERDPLLPEKLAAELPGILAWAVRGNFYWQKNGISAPNTVRDATAAYQRDQDMIGQFLAECCEVGDSLQVGAGMLYQAYEGWAKQQGLRAESGTKFGTDLNRRGFHVKRNMSGKTRVGLDLNTYGRTFGPAIKPHWSDD